MAFTVHQSASAVDTGTGMSVTLSGGTTNGRFLVVLYGAVSAGRSQTLGGSWEDILNQACNAGEAGGWAYAAFRPISAGENSVSLIGTSTTGNQYAALFEVSCTSGSLVATDFVVNDLSGTGTTIALGAVDAVAGDLVMALGVFHDDDGTGFTWSNSFGSGPIYRETSSGDPDIGAQASYRIVTSSTTYSTTATVSGGPNSDQRHGFMFTLHEQIVGISRSAGVGAAIAVVGGIVTRSLVAGIGSSIAAVAGIGSSIEVDAGVNE